MRSLLRPPQERIEALHNVDLVIRRGEIVAYAGPNGAGKSTTIKLLSGLLAPDQGSVRALGFDPVTERAEYVARIGVVYGQRTELWWDMPISATFEWKRVVWDIPDERYTRMLAFVRQRLGLDAFFDALARELSLGQRMRADLALSLIHEPDILLLDEPTVGVDVLAKKWLLDAIREIHRERGVTVLLTSHDMDELEQLAARMVLIDKGRIAFDGSFESLRRDLGGKRRLFLTTSDARAPELAIDGVTWISSHEGKHEFAFDPTRVNIAALLAAASEKTQILDLETHREPIDAVIASIYERWTRT